MRNRTGNLLSEPDAVLISNDKRRLLQANKQGLRVWTQKTNFTFFIFLPKVSPRALEMNGWPVADSSVAKINIILTYKSVPFEIFDGISSETKSFSCHAVTIRKEVCI